MKARLMGVVAGVAALTLGSVSVQAGGLFIPGAGPQAQSRAGAFVAKADDPTAMFHNPAGFMKNSGTVLQLGFNFVDLSLEFQRAGTYRVPAGESLSYGGDPYASVSDNSKPAVGFGGFQAIPAVGVATDFGLQKKLGIPIRFGFGIMAPQAFPERNFDNGYQFEGDINEAPPAQRYDVFTQTAATVLPTVAVAYQVSSKLDVGARFSAGFAEIKGKSYLWGIANYTEWIARDGTFDINVKDNFIPAYGFGVLYRPSTNLEVGASYSSAINIDAKGDGKGVLGSDLGLDANTPDRLLPLTDADRPACARGGTIDHLKTCVTFQIPQTAHVGARYILRDSKGGEKADIEFDVKWEDWSNASETRVVVDGKSEIVGTLLKPTVIKHGLIDTFSFRLGGSYTMAMGGNALSIKGGAAYDTRAAPGSWNRLDMDSNPRVTLATGVAYTIGRFRIEVGGGIVLEKDRTVSDACKPTITNEGCLGTGEETPIPDRDHPDPAQPLIDETQQVETPFNGGTYKSGYVLLHLGLTTWF